MSFNKTLRMVVRYMFVFSGLVLWAMIENIGIGSFFYIVPSALILIPLYEAIKDAKAEYEEERNNPIAEDVRRVIVRDNRRFNFTDEECSRNPQDRPKKRTIKLVM